MFRSYPAVGIPGGWNSGGWKSRRLETASTQTMSAGRRRRGYWEIENHWVKSSTRSRRVSVCVPVKLRGFNRRVFGWMGDRVFGWMGDRVFCGCAIEFLGYITSGSIEMIS